MGFFGDEVLKTESELWKQAHKSHGPGPAHSLRDAVANLSPKAKQAMYSAASHGLIKRRTWDGCAFNQAGEVLGDQSVTSTGRAAQAFEMPSHRVAEFIHQWDSMPGSDQECTRFLIKCLNEVGLFSEPAWKVAAQRPHQRVQRVVRTRVFTSYETKMREAFDATNDIAPVEGAAEAGLLLSGACI